MLSRALTRADRTFAAGPVPSFDPDGTPRE